MNWNMPDQNVKNIVWSERCQKEGKGASVFLQKAQEASKNSGPQHLTTKWAVGPGSINERRDRFLDRNVPLLAALSNFVDRDDTPEARYVKSFSTLRKEKVASPPIGGTTSRRSISRTALPHDSSLDEGHVSPPAGNNRGLNAAIGAGNVFGTSLITEGMVPTKYQPMGVQEKRRTKERLHAAMKDSEVGDESREIKLPLVVQKELEKKRSATASSMTESHLSVPSRADQERKLLVRASSTTSGDYGWIPPSKRVAAGTLTPSHHTRYEWQDPRLNHPLSQSDITRVLYK